MELERICTVAVGNLFAESFGQVDDLDGFVGAAFYAHTAADAEGLGHEADGGFVGDLDAHFSLFVDGAGFGAFLVALLGFALVRVDDSNSKLILAFHVFLGV